MVGSCVNSNTVRKISDQPTPVLYGGGDDEDDDDDDDDLSLRWREYAP